MFKMLGRQFSRDRQRSTGLRVTVLVGLMLLGGCKKAQPHQAIEGGDYRALERTLAGGADPDGRNEQQVPLLHCAISKGDAKAVSILLEYGADLGVRDPEGRPAFESALVRILERKGEKWAARENPEERSIAVLREIMHSVRKKSYSEIETEGKLNVGLSIGGIKDGMFQGSVHVTFRCDEREYTLHLSQYETDYDGVPRTGAGGGILRSGQACRISGYEKDGEVEVTELEYVGEPSEGGELDIPISYLLPSTYNAMDNRTWVRDHGANDGSDL